MSKLDERLKILVEGEVVIPKAAEIAKKAVERLESIHGVLPEDKVNMLVTHLASALTRLDRGETVEAPPEVLLREVGTSPFIREASLEIEWIEHEWGIALPVEEKQFLSVHYVSVLQETLGGEK